MLPAEDRDLVLQRIVELGDRKHVVTPDDLPYLIADVQKTPDEQLVKIESWRVHVSSGETPTAEVAVAYKGVLEKAESTGDGGYDAFMNALRKAARALAIEISRPRGLPRAHPARRPDRRARRDDDHVAGRAPAQSPRHQPGESFTTLGVDSDQLAAAVIATEKMLNAVASRRDRDAEKKPARERRRSEDGAARTSG